MRRSFSDLKECKDDECRDQDKTQQRRPWIDERVGNGENMPDRESMVGWIKNLRQIKDQHARFCQQSFDGCKRPLIITPGYRFFDCVKECKKGKGR
jgi:hypothetical protein